MSKLFTQVHSTTGTTTLSLPPVNTASVSEATDAHAVILDTAFVDHMDEVKDVHRSDSPL